MNKAVLPGKLYRTIVVLSLSLSPFYSAQAQQNTTKQDAPLPPPPSYAQPTNPNPAMRRPGPGGYNNPYARNPYAVPPMGPNGYGRQFGPGYQRFPSFNSRRFPMPWNGNRRGPLMSTSNMPWLDSSRWARKVPDWGKNNGPYSHTPLHKKGVKNKLEDMWDDMVNAPHDAGRMPGGWKAPSISMPNPVDVTDQFGMQFDKLPSQIREMDVGNDVSTGDDD